MYPFLPQQCSGPARRPGRYNFLMGCVFGLITLLFVLSACEPIAVPTLSKATPTIEKQPTVAAPKNLHAAGYLTVGSSLDYFPQASFGVQQQPVGFDIDLIQAIAKRMGLKMQLIQSEFRLLPDQLKNGSVDVIISAISITDQMKQKMDFVDYLNGGESLLVGKGNPEHIQSLSDLCGKRVGVLPDTVEQDDLKLESTTCVQKQLLPITIVLLKSQSDSVDLLISSQISATYQDSALTDYLVKQNPLLEMAGAVTNQRREGIGVRKGDTVMMNAIKTAFQQLQDNGTYHFLITTWGLNNEELAPQNQVDRVPSGAVQQKLIAIALAREYLSGCGRKLR